MIGDSHASRIMALLADSPGLNDDEIASALSIEPRQTVNQVCRRLAARGVLERTRGSAGKIINLLVTAPAAPERHPVPARAPARSTAQGTGMVLTPDRFETTLLVIPCSKAKVRNDTATERGASLIDALAPPLATELRGTRKNVAQRISIDESTLMPAWRRYDGALYRSSQGALGELLQQGTHIIILSGGYGAVLAEEPIGLYDAVLKPAWWPNGILPRILISYAASHGISSVRAFASATSPYFRVLTATRWHEAGITDAFLLAPEAAPGGTRKSPASLGEALIAFRNRNLRVGWKSSYGLDLDIYGG